MLDETVLNKYYGEIANKLDEIIPCEWEKIALYVSELGNWSFATFYFYTSDGKCHHWGDIADKYGIDIREISGEMDVLSQISKQLWLECKEVWEEPWYSFTFSLDSDWKFNIKYGYEKNEELSGKELQVRWAYDELGIVPSGKMGKRLLKKYLEEQDKDIPEELR